MEVHVSQYIVTTCSVIFYLFIFIFYFLFIYFFFFLVVVAGHQGSSQSDLCTNTGFGSFKLPTCDWLQKGRSHSRTESSLVFWLRCIVHGFTRGLCMLFNNKCLFRPI